MSRRPARRRSARIALGQSLLLGVLLVAGLLVDMVDRWGLYPL